MTNQCYKQKTYVQKVVIKNKILIITDNNTYKIQIRWLITN